MGIALITIKMMPSSPETDLEALKTSAKELIETNEGQKVRFEEQPVAFGLKAVLAFFELDEENDTLDAIEEKLATIENITSVQITDMRRAFG